MKGIVASRQEKVNLQSITLHGAELVQRSHNHIQVPTQSVDTEKRTNNRWSPVFLN